jgi:selenocysteine-specific translation elongation factor
MKCASYVVVAIVVIGIGAWVCWQWMRSQPAQPAPASASFRMPIDDAFALKVPGKVVVVGKIAEGEVRPGDRLKIKHGDDEISVEVEALEAFGAPVSVGRAGSNIGIMLIGATKEQIVAGAILSR